MGGKELKISLKTAIIIICIIAIFFIGIIVTIKLSEPIIEQPVTKKQTMPAIIRYDKNGRIIKTIELNSNEDLSKLSEWIYLCDFYLEDEEPEEELENINIRKDVTIKYNDSIEIDIQLGQEEYCYYKNKEKNISYVSDMLEDQYAWVEEKIGGIDKEGKISEISYKIYDNYNQGPYDYTKRGYYSDRLKQLDSPVWYIITGGERPEQSYIIIQDIKIDNEKNIEVIIKEYIGSSFYPDVIGYEIPKIYPACCIEFDYNSAKNIRSIIIKNTEGEVFESLN